MRQRKHKWINGTKGAISLLLAMLLLPFYSLAAVLVENMRYQSAVRTLDELLGTSSVSTLSQYDKHLKDRFGLLAVEQSDSDDALTDSTLFYLEKNQLIDTAGIDMDRVSATGMYPLADTRVLRHQVEEYSKVLVPAKLVTDGLHIESIVKTFEESFKIDHIFNAIYRGADAAGAWADTISQVNDAIEVAEQTQEDVKTYDSKFEDWKTAVTALKDHLETTCPDPETDAEGYQEWIDTRTELEDQAEAAQTEYQDAVSSMKNSVENLQTSANSVLESAGKAVIKTKAAKDQAANSALVIGDGKEAENQLNALNDALQTAAGSMSNRTEKLMASFATEEMRSAYDQLAEEETRLQETKLETLKTQTDAEMEQLFHDAQVQDLADPTALAKVVADSVSDLAAPGLLEVISSLIDGYKKVFATTSLYDPTINCQLDMNYYTGELTLPSKKDRSGPYALADSDKADEEKALRFLKEIDAEFDPENPFGVACTFDKDLCPRIFKNLLGLSIDIDVISAMFGTVQMVKAVVDACERVKLLVTDIKTFVKQFDKQVKYLTESLGNRTLLNGYLIYNLPNRTTYCDPMARTLSYYYFSKIAFGQSTDNVLRQLPGEANDVLSLIQAVETGGGVPSKAFGGAELEYVIWGENSEMLNQFYQFAALFALRAVLSVQILLNKDVQKICSTTAEAVPELLPVVVIALVLLEAYMDTVLLVNGGSVTLLNVKSPYVTPKGMLKWVDSMTSKVFAPTIDKSLIDRLKDIDFLSFNYQQHSLFLMMLFGDEEEYLLRLADLIQSESCAYQELHASAFTGMDSEKPFNIDESYTVIRTEASGTLTPLLPVPVLSGRNPLTMNRLVYRGY